MSVGCVRVLVVRKDTQMESRYRKLNILDLAEVEKEIELMFEIRGFDLDDEDFEYVSSLIKLAKSLGSTKNW